MTDTDKGMSTGSGCLLLLFLVPLLGFVLDLLFFGTGLFSFVWKAIFLLHDLLPFRIWFWC